jgi:hypothetical protein
VWHMARVTQHWSLNQDMLSYQSIQC